MYFAMYFATYTVTFLCFVVGGFLRYLMNLSNNRGKEN